MGIIGLVFFRNNINFPKLTFLSRNLLTNRVLNWQKYQFHELTFLDSPVLIEAYNKTFQKLLNIRGIFLEEKNIFFKNIYELQI